MAEKGTINCAELLDRGYLENLLWGAGIYKIRISDKAYRRPIHGPSPIIHIGKAAHKRSGLSWRIGEFIAGAMGLQVAHSTGTRFYDVRDVLELSIRDLEIDWEKVGPSRAAQREKAAFDRFIRALTQEDKDLLLELRRKIIRDYNGLVVGVKKLYPLLSLRRG